MSIVRAVPVLQVADVAASIDWYASALGFRADPFPQKPPYSFAILRRDEVEIMLQRAPGPTAPTPAVSPLPRAGWAIYLRLDGGGLIAFADAVRRQTPVLRGPERLFYGQVEFEVADPDGYRICIGEPLPPDTAVPCAKE